MKRFPVRSACSKFSGWVRFAPAVFAAALSPCASYAALEVARIHCELQTNPINIETSAPRFGWELQSDDRGAQQGAYHVLAATRPELLQPGKADLWDSGRQETSQSLYIPYGGAALRSNQVVHWTVRTWDHRGQPSNWAKPAEFRTAFLAPDEWEASWIGAPENPGAAEIPFHQAKWIWGRVENSTTGDGPPAVRPGEMRIFRRAVHVTAGTVPGSAVLPMAAVIGGSAKVTSATLSMAADNEAQAWVNGERVGESKEWEQIRQFDICQHFKPGANVITIAARNGGRRPNPAALLAVVSVSTDDGETTHVVTDGHWSATVPVEPGSLKNASLLKLAPEYVSNGGPAMVVGDWGKQPWDASSVVAGPMPIFRKGFRLAQKPFRAVVHISGLGHQKLFVNGKPASDTFLDPPWSKYEKTSFYNTYDITSLLQTGPNVLGVMLANGFYNTRGDRRTNHNRADRQLRLIAQAEIEFADGTSETVVSDGSWFCRPGPYTHSSILGGVDYDARQLPDGWDGPHAKQPPSWQNVQVLNPDGSKLAASYSPSMKTFDEFDPKLIDEPESGIFVYDFGQNASATPRLKIRGPAGATIRLTYSEQRGGSTDAHNDGKGRADQSGIRAPNYLEYTCRGEGEEEWFPHLFYSGFQYIELTGGVPAGKPNPQNLPVVTELKSVHVRSGAPTVGTFASSDPMYEKIDEMVDWSVRSNMGHVLTDCPTREKMGWLEVIHLMWPSIASRYDLSQFGRKVAHDIRDSQLPDGKVHTVAPDYAVFQGPFQYTPEWGASATLVPWYTYKWYGDLRVLQENYACMKGFVDYMHQTSTDLVPIAGLGDWYDYGHGQELGPSRFTPTELTAMATFADCARVVSEAAAALGNQSDAKKYAELVNQIRAKFNVKFAQSPTEYKHSGSPQTANAIALVAGLVPVEKQRSVLDGIIADMEQRGWLQTAGDVGFHYLVRALADWGRDDAIFNMLARKQLGSYQYLANAGWTSLPESWNAFRHYSMNHCMLGHIQEWFSQNLVGIKQAEGSVGYQHIQFQPVVDGPITSASGTLQCPYGEIACAWERKGELLGVMVTVPVNTEADLLLPANWAAAEIRESGKPIESLVHPTTNGALARLTLGSGRYHFQFSRR